MCGISLSLGLAMYTYNQFISFLEENGCRKEFEAAFYEFNRCHYFNEVMLELLCPDEFLFGRVFDWSATPQGRDFWKEISDRWYRFTSNSL